MTSINTHFNHSASPAEDRHSSQAEHRLPINGALAPSQVTYTSTRRLTTEEFAAGLRLQAQSIRKRYSQTGSYFDIKPIKLPNGRLSWPADAVGQLVAMAM